MAHRIASAHHSVRGITLFLAALGVLACAASMAADETLSRPVGPGVVFGTIARPDGPWEIRVFRVARDEPLVRLQCVPGYGVVKGVQQLSGMIADCTRDNDYVIAGCNADFFVMAGNPAAGTLCGLMIRDGELIMTGRGRPAFVALKDGTPIIGNFDTQVKLTTPHGTLPRIGFNQRASKDIAAACTQTWGWPGEEGAVVLRVGGLPITLQGAWEGVVTERVGPGQTRDIGPGEIILHADGYAQGIVGKLVPGDRVQLETITATVPGPASLGVGGSAELVKGGEIVLSEGPDAPRHPRTAIGYNEREIILVTVDGRQRGWSVGMTLTELAALMKELGCTDALNLDGGGSTTAWVRGEVVNRPSDGGERRIANALLVRSKAPKGPPSRLTLRPDRIVAMPGATIPLKVFPSDEWYNPAEVDLDALALVQDGEPAKAVYSKGSLVAGDTCGEYELTISHPRQPQLKGAISLKVVAACPLMTITPQVANLLVGETVQFTVQGQDQDGTPIWLAAKRTAWSVQGDGVAHLGGGKFRAQAPGKSVVVTAKVGDASISATIKVAFEMPVEDFEKDPKAEFAVYPETAGITGGLEYLTTGRETGARYCRLKFDLGEPKGTRAAYMMVNRNVGAALKLSVRARTPLGASPWIRAGVLDGAGGRHTFDLATAGVSLGNWTTLETRLPDDLKPPIVWQSVYVVALDGKRSSGQVDIDDLKVFRLME